MVAQNLSPSLPVDAPVIHQEQHNLLSSITPLTLDDGHWGMGLAFTPEGWVYPVKAEILDAGAAKSSAVSGEQPVDYTPFLIELAITRPGSWPQDVVEAIAMRAMEQTQSSLIEDLMTKGSVTGSQYLVDSNTTLFGANAAVPQVAMARLYESIAAAGGEVTFYMSPGVADILGTMGLKEYDGKLYTLARGDLVVVGNYGVPGPNAGTSGTDESYIYAHLGRPVVRLGGYQIYTEIDWTTNDWVCRVERSVAVTFQPGQWLTLAKFA